MDEKVILNNFIPALNQTELVYDVLHNSTFVGIDFGTSTTVASYAVINNGIPPIKTDKIPIKQEKPDGIIIESHLVPSIVAWYNEKLLFGEGAKFVKHKLTPNRNIWSSFKMSLGINLGPMYYNTELNFNHPVATIENPRQAAAVFFKFLRKQVECFIKSNSLPSNIKYSVSIPASFESNQRTDLFLALEDAGIKVNDYSLIDEPNAAFLSYLAESNSNSLGQLNISDDTNLHILVFDFGAGTCDISILEIGKDFKGLYTKNLAISRFEELGGDDIDRIIAKEILFPILLLENNISRDDLSTADINKRIIPKLMKPAEDLKVTTCKNVAKQIIGYRLPSVAQSDKAIELGYSVEISLPKRKLVLSKPTIKYRQFWEVMNSFFCNDEEDTFSDINISNDKKIDSLLTLTLEKAGLPKENLDMVLLVGGSSDNPYLQSKLREYFRDVEIEIPRDTRSHVSVGAAVNSFLVNGLNVNLVHPIISEPIILLSKENRATTLLPAGTQIPTITYFNEDFLIQNENPDFLEIPIFVSDLSKLLTVIRLDLSEIPQVIRKGEKVTIEYKVNTNKLLEIRVKIGNHALKAECINPFANSALSNNERIVLTAEKKMNEIIYHNYGKPPIDALWDLFVAYKKANEHIKCAETLELIQNKSYAPDQATNICYYYSLGGNKNKSSQWAKRAYDERKTAVNCFNYALEIKETGNTEEYERLMEECLKLDKDAFYAMIAYGRHLASKDQERAKELVEKGFNGYYDEFNKGILNKSDFFRLRSAASFLNKNDILSELIKAEKSMNTSETWYDEKNLLQKRDIKEIK